MATVEQRGPYQFRVRVRRKGVSETRTFESRSEAEDWARVVEGKITGDEYVDRRKARDTTLSQACDWFLERGVGTNADAKNLKSKLGYWKTTEFAGWSLVTIHDWDLIEWRRRLLDEDGAEDDEACGPEAECGAQTAIHRLNALSKLIQIWARAHRVPLDNPVKPGVRPSKPDGRDRRLRDGEEERLVAAALQSSRPWLNGAITIAIETCMRQGELAGLKWNRVKLRAEHPYVDLNKTKNDKLRRVPLSRRAVVAFETLASERGTAVAGGLRVLPVETPRAIIHAFRDAVTDKEFPDLRWHDLRHEAISRLFELTDLRESEIMAITGHLTRSMLDRYTHLRADRLGPRLPGGDLNPSTPR